VVVGGEGHESCGGLRGAVAQAVGRVTGSVPADDVIDEVVCCWGRCGDEGGYDTGFSFVGCAGFV